MLVTAVRMKLNCFNINFVENHYTYHYNDSHSHEGGNSGGSKILCKPQTMDHVQHKYAATEM
jgi:hypothetical protein